MKDEVTKRVAEICDRNRDALLSVVDLLARHAKPLHEPDAQAAEIRHTLERIKAKDCVSADEAALLFGCSAQHLRNQVQRALDNKASVPIPYRDLDGIICFPVVELMEWSRTPKPKEKRGRKNKTHLGGVGVMKNLATSRANQYSHAAPTPSYAVCPAETRKERT